MKECEDVHCVSVHELGLIKALHDLGHNVNGQLSLQAGQLGARKSSEL